MTEGNVFATPLPQPPHQLSSLFGSKMSLSSQQQQQPSNSRKRKATDDDDMRMSTSPSASPSIPSQTLPQPTTSRPIKKSRVNAAVGRPLSLSRLLETLDAESLRSVLRTVVDAHPSFAAEIPRLAPRPSVSSALDVLRRYQHSLQAAFPFGGDPSSDYSYNRVRSQLSALLEALADFTPHFLPPHESSPQTSLTYLDGATQVLHELPNWTTFQNNVGKLNAYDEISRAWVVAVQEAGKRAAGISLRYDGWDKKLAKHNQMAQGRLQSAVDEMNGVLNWASGGGGGAPGPSSGRSERESVRDQLLSGTYGSNIPVRVGPW